jgi:nitrate/TMAO reductase-like tetraheme cytochrome c subunit
MNTRASSNRRLAVLAGVAALVVVAGASAVHYTSQPSFCGSCHEMEVTHSGWTKGSHAKTDCYACHVDSTLAGHIYAKANGLRQVYVHFTHEKVDMDRVTAHVPNQRCQRCHDTQDKEKLGERLVLAHAKHLEAKLECTVCHLNSGHSKEAFVGFTRESCQECHSKKPQEQPNPYLKRPVCKRPAEGVAVFDKSLNAF